MLDEAERLGLSVTQTEVDAEFTAQRKNYEDFLEVRTYIDAYCKTAGITLEEYYAAIQEQLPRVILRQKLRNELGQEYCAEHQAGIYEGQSAWRYAALCRKLSGGSS